MRYCISCGAEAGPLLRFCTTCGAALPAAVQAAAQPAATPAQRAPWSPAEVPPAPADSVFAPPAPPPWSSSGLLLPREDEYWAADESVGGSRRGLVIGAAVLAAVLVAGGGYLVADRVLGGDDGAGRSTGAENEHDESAGARPVEGDPLQPRSVTASCQAPPGVDAANVPVTYDPMNTLDGVGSTAWRCAGSAVGQQLVFDFGRPVTLDSVGLVPGYAKIDPVDGTDRFGENRTVTAVRWRFDGGSSYSQDIPTPSAAMARSPLDEPVTTTRVVLEITRTGNDGAVRDFTTISDVAFTGSE